MTTDLGKIAEDSTRGGFFLTVGNTVSVLVSALSVFIIARILGPEQYGLYSVSTVMPSLLILFVNPGISQGLIKYTASLRAKGEEQSVAKLLLHGLSAKILLGLTATFVCFMFSDLFARQILNRPEITPYIQLASTLIILQTVYTTINSTFVGLDKTEYNAVITGSQAIVKALISSSLVIIGLGIFGALSGYIAGSLAASVLGIFIFYKTYSLLNHNHGVSNEHFSGNVRLLIRYGFPLYLSALLGGLVLQYQNILLALFTTNIDMGNFQAAKNFTVLIGTLSFSIATTLLAAFSKLEQKSEETKRLFRLCIKYVSMIIVPIATIIMLYSNEMVRIIYGEGYKTASFLLSLGTIQYYLVGFGSLVLGSFFNGMGDTKTTFKISLLRLSAFIIMALPMTWAFKVPGTIIATLISTLLASIYGLSVAKSKLNVRIESKNTMRIYIASLLPVLPLVALQRILPLTGLPQLILGATIYLTTYLVLAPLLKVVSQTEIAELKTILNNIRPLKIITKPLFYFEEAILSKIP